jgi:diguanylate cyclase (GGDEF)-like protein
MMGILDIDNFKLVNDNYGHHVGDECLKSIATGLADFVGEDGLVGRFGGDEFVIIHFKDTEYQPVHDYISRLYNEGNVIRRKLMIDNVSFLVTATIGCASFPKDSYTYKDLFLKIDKALYRGKTKGRNCFIVYVDSKHRDIDVHRRDFTSLPILFDSIASQFSKNRTVDEIVKNVVDYITESLQLGMTFVVTVKDNKVISSQKRVPYYYDKEYVDVLKDVVKDQNIYASSDLKQLKDDSKRAMEYLTTNHIQSIIVAKIKVEDYFYGYLALYENKIIRIWQENDIALVMYVEKLLAMLFLLRMKK